MDMFRHSAVSLLRMSYYFLRFLLPWSQRHGNSCILLAAAIKYYSHSTMGGNYGSYLQLLYELVSAKWCLSASRYQCYFCLMRRKGYQFFSTLHVFLALQCSVLLWNSYTGILWLYCIQYNIKCFVTPRPENKFIQKLLQFLTKSNSEKDTKIYSSDSEQDNQST